MPDLQKPAPPINYARPDTNRRPGVRRSIWAVPAVVVLLVLLWAAILVPRFSSNPGQAKQAAAQQEISNFAGALDSFKADNGRYPTNKEGLAALLARPANAPSWQGPYLANNGNMSKDPWGNPYVYRNPGKHNPKDVDVFSMGRDGRVGGGDDIGNW